jgi:hypothetical protein
MTIALALASWLALGLPTGWLLARRGRPELGAAALPFAGGLALLLPVIASAWLDGPLAVWGAQAAITSAAIALAAAGLLAGTEPVEAPPWPSRPSLAVAGCVTLAAGAGLFQVAAVLASGWPGYGWDGLAIWLVRAKLLASSAVLPEALFREPLLADGHWDYPLLLPALLAWCARLADLGVREYALGLGAVLAPLPLAVALATTRWLGAPLAASLAIAPLAVPTLLPIHFEGYADPLLAYVAAAGIAVALGGALRRDAALSLLGGLMLAFAVGLKNEGVLWWAAGVAGAGAVCLVVRVPLGAGLAALARVGLPGLLVFGLWQLTCARLGVSSDLTGEPRWDLVLERIGFVTGLLVRLLLSLESAPWVIACVVAGVALVGGDVRERARRVAALAVPLGVYLAGLALVYLITPYDVRWHVATSLPRTLLGVGPVLFACAALAPCLRRAAADGVSRAAGAVGSAGRDRR